MLFNGRIHHRLCYGRLVGFVVPATSVTDEVNDDIFLKLIAVVDSQLSDKNNRFGVITVNVEYRRLNHLRDVSAVLG